MHELQVIGWFICLILSIMFVFNFVGLNTMINLFPEGNRWWMFPAQLLSLAVFAMVVLIHPF